MDWTVNNDMPCWYVIHTKPQQEDRAEYNLRAWHVETFSPKIKSRQHNKFTGKATYVSRPLFPRYIFARFKAGALWHKVSFTRGVHSVVCMDGRPTPVDDEIIEMIQSQKGEDGFIRTDKVLHPGDKVMISEGPLRNMVGIFEGRLKDDERVSILLTTVSYQSRVVIELAAVRKAS
jgi:transcriptional antiterminator RfaH